MTFPGAAENESGTECLTDEDEDGWSAENTDCDDEDSSLLAIADDQDCDGVVTADDCNDANNTQPVDDADCDGFLTFEDCDDFDSGSTIVATDMDCDGVLTIDDCDDCDDSDPNTVNDMDCDGVLSINDCNDNDITQPNLDQDCDGVLTVYDCDDTDPLTVNDMDCDDVLISDDCNDSDSTQPSLDQDCDGVLTINDCNDLHAEVYPGAVELCDGWDNDCNGIIEEEIERWDFDIGLGASYDSTHDFTGNHVPNTGVCNGGVENTGILSANAGSLSQYNNGFSVLLWAKGDGALLAKSQSGHGVAEEFAMNGGASTDFIVNSGGSGASSPRASVSGACDTRISHRFIVGRGAYNQSLDLYCDGTLIDSDNSFGSMAWSGQPFYIGANPAGGLETGTYEIDELKLYSCPLTASSIEAHYVCGGCGCNDTNHPCAYGDYWDGAACQSIQ